MSEEHVENTAVEEESTGKTESVEAIEPIEATVQAETAEQLEKLEDADSVVKKQLRRSERGVKEYQYFLIRLAVLLLLIWVLFFKVVGLTHMPNGDMYPRLDMGDLVLYYRLDTDVRAQDVVVLEKLTPDTLEKKLYICRVVAVAGDTVEITDAGHLVINGNTMIESNIFSLTPRYEGFTEYPLTLGEGQCFVLADHRDGGADSRYFGPVDKSELVGTVITIVRRNAL